MSWMLLVFRRYFFRFGSSFFSLRRCCRRTARTNWNANDEEFLDDRIAGIRIRSQFSIIILFFFFSPVFGSTREFDHCIETPIHARIVMISSKLVASVCNWIGVYLRIVSYVSSVRRCDGHFGELPFFVSHSAQTKLASLRLLIQLSVHISCIMFLASEIIVYAFEHPTDNQRGEGKKNWVACTHRIWIDPPKTNRARRSLSQ